MPCGGSKESEKPHGYTRRQRVVVSSVTETARTERRANAAIHSNSCQVLIWVLPLAARCTTKVRPRKGLGAHCALWLSPLPEPPPTLRPRDHVQKQKQVQVATA